MEIARGSRGNPSIGGQGWTSIEQWRAGFERPSDIAFRQLLDKLPAAAYTTDAEGLITYFNQRGVELWGREPKLNDPHDRFCGSFRLYDVGGPRPASTTIS